MIRKTICIDIDIDFQFFALLPAFNINLHMPQIEFEWLFIGIYLYRKEPDAEECDATEAQKNCLS
jgi:hypothetical protein